MLQVHEDGERVVERLVAADATQVRDRTDAAGVVLVLRAIEAGRVVLLAHGTPLFWFPWRV